MNKKIVLLLFTFLCVFFTAPAQWTQTGEDIDGEAAYDNSGTSVSLSSDGLVVAIGARANDGNGDMSGHVRVFKNYNELWTQIGDDIDGEGEGDYFGEAVSLNYDGSIVAASSNINTPDEEDSGQVRIFQNINNTWTQIGQNLDGEAPGYQFGHSVSLSMDGLVVAIGTPYYSNGEEYSIGNTQIFQYIDNTWTQIGQDIIGEAEGDHSGLSVSLSDSGSIVAIGANNNNGNGNGSGHVRVYQNYNGTWTQIGEDIDGEAPFDHSGFSVSLSSDGLVVAIGAWVNDDNGDMSGHVRVYKNIEGTWIQIGQDIDGEAIYDNSGQTVSLNSDGMIVAIGARMNDGNGYNSGHARIYNYINQTWVQIGQDIDGENIGDHSGYSVSLNDDGTKVAIGARNNSGNGTSSGHVRVFENSILSTSETIILRESLYPNPTKGILYLKHTNNNNLLVYIYDITGKLTFEKQLFFKKSLSQIDISNFENGIYLIKIQDNNQLYTAKVVKQ